MSPVEDGESEAHSGAFFKENLELSTACTKTRQNPGSRFIPGIDLCGLTRFLLV